MYLSSEEAARLTKEADEAISAYLNDGDTSKYGSYGGFVIKNLVIYIRELEHQIESYRTKYEPPFDSYPPTLPKRMEKVIRRPTPPNPE